MAEEFQKAECSEEIPELERDVDQYSDGLGGVLPVGGKLDHPIPQMFEWVGKERGTTQEEEKRKPNTLEVELDLSGQFTRGNTMGPV